MIQSISRKLLTIVATVAALAAWATYAQAADQAFNVDQYEIQPEDVLDVFVWREPDLQKSVVVRPDGGISFPLVGNIQAAGKTTSQLQADVAAKLREYIPDAVVNVSITELKGMRIYVTGKVARPGQYEIGRYIDVLQALTLAGGPNPFADANNIRVLRGAGENVVVYEFNYNQVQRGKNLEQNILLKPNDTVVVP